MAVTIAPGEALEPGVPQTLFQTNLFVRLFLRICGQRAAGVFSSSKRSRAMRRPLGSCSIGGRQLKHIDNG